MTVLEQFARAERITHGTALAVSWGAGGWKISDPDVMFKIPMADNDPVDWELIPLWIETIPAPIPLWVAVCAACLRSTRPCERISLALDEWRDHTYKHVGR